MGWEKFPLLLESSPNQSCRRGRRGGNARFADKYSGLAFRSGGGSSTTIGATCFAVGSTLFSYLFLRARSIPVPLAWLGVLASVLLVIALPVELAGFLPGSLAWPIWLPMLIFEVTLALWLIGKGVTLPVPRPSR